MRALLVLVILAGCSSTTSSTYRGVVDGRLPHPDGEFSIRCDGEVQCGEDLFDKNPQQRCRTVSRRCAIHEAVRRPAEPSPQRFTLVPDASGAAELVGHDARGHVLFFTAASPAGRIHLRGVTTHGSPRPGRPVATPAAFDPDLTDRDRLRFVLDGRALLRRVGRTGRVLVWELGTGRVAAGDLGEVPQAGELGESDRHAILCRPAGDGGAVELVTLDLAALLEAGAATPSSARGEALPADYNEQQRALRRCVAQAGATAPAPTR